MWRERVGLGRHSESKVTSEESEGGGARHVTSLGLVRTSGVSGSSFPSCR